jgi:hypothetical protein
MDLRSGSVIRAAGRWLGTANETGVGSWRLAEAATGRHSAAPRPPRLRPACGIFAGGAGSAGWVRRVAGAAGDEGSVSVGSAHEYLEGFCSARQAVRKGPAAKTGL